MGMIENIQMYTENILISKSGTFSVHARMFSVRTWMFSVRTRMFSVCIWMFSGFSFFVGIINVSNYFSKILFSSIEYLRTKNCFLSFIRKDRHFVAKIH